MVFMKFATPKRPFCSYCARIIAQLAVVWQDEEGRVYRYHRLCARAAEDQREKEKTTKPY
jgi:hypothetical protein